MITHWRIDEQSGDDGGSFLRMISLSIYKEFRVFLSACDLLAGGVEVEVGGGLIKNPNIPPNQSYELP